MNAPPKDSGVLGHAFQEFTLLGIYSIYLLSGLFKAHTHNEKAKRNMTQKDKGILERALDGAKDLVSDAAKAVDNMADAAVDAGKATLNAAGNVVEGAADLTGDAVKGAVNMAADAGEAVAKTVTDV